MLHKYNMKNNLITNLLGLFIIIPPFSQKRSGMEFNIHSQDLLISIKLENVDHVYQTSLNKSILFVLSEKYTHTTNMFARLKINGNFCYKLMSNNFLL